MLRLSDAALRFRADCHRPLRVLSGSREAAHAENTLSGSSPLAPEPGSESSSGARVLPVPSQVLCAEGPGAREQTTVQEQTVLSRSRDTADWSQCSRSSGWSLPY